MEERVVDCKTQKLTLQGLVRMYSNMHGTYFFLPDKNIHTMSEDGDGDVCGGLGRALV